MLTRPKNFGRKLFHPIPDSPIQIVGYNHSTALCNLGVVFSQGTTKDAIYTKENVTTPVLTTQVKFKTAVHPILDPRVISDTINPAYPSNI